MNWWLLAAALLVLGSALAHSLLGEKVVLRRVYRHAHDTGGQNRRAADDPLTRQTIRLAWHSLTIALLGFAALLVQAGLSGLPHGNGWDVALKAISLTFGALSLLSLVIAKGRHIGWMWFLATAIAIWLSVG
jgi:hypothetical protein